MNLKPYFRPNRLDDNSKLVELDFKQIVMQRKPKSIDNFFELWIFKCCFLRVNCQNCKSLLRVRFCTLEAKPLILGQIWGNQEFSERALKELLNALFRGASSSRGMCRFAEKYWNRQNLTFGDLWWPDLSPDLQNDQSVSSWFLTLFRMPLTRFRYMAQEPS